MTVLEKLKDRVQGIGPDIIAIPAFEQRHLIEGSEGACLLASWLLDSTP